MSLLLDMICNKLHPKEEKEQEIPTSDFAAAPRPASINRLGLQCGSADALDDLPPITRGPRPNRQAPKAPARVAPAPVTPAPAFGPSLPEKTAPKPENKPLHTPPPRKVRKRKATWRLPEPLLREIKTLAESTGRTQVSLVTEALQGYVSFKARRAKQ